MSSVYSITDILLARIECLVGLGYSRHDAARLVAETWGQGDRPPAA